MQSTQWSETEVFVHAIFPILWEYLSKKPKPQK